MVTPKPLEYAWLLQSLWTKRYRVSIPGGRKNMISSLKIKMVAGNKPVVGLVPYGDWSTGVDRQSLACLVITKIDLADPSIFLFVGWIISGPLNIPPFITVYPPMFTGCNPTIWYFVPTSCLKREYPILSTDSKPNFPTPKLPCESVGCVSHHIISSLHLLSIYRTVVGRNPAPFDRWSIPR